MMEFINGKDYRMTSLFYEMENKNQMVETTNQVTGWWFKSSLACGKFKSTSQPWRFLGQKNVLGHPKRLQNLPRFPQVKQNSTHYCCWWSTNVNPGLINPVYGSWTLGGYHKKVSDEMTIWGVPFRINKPWFINPGLTLVLEFSAQMIILISLQRWAMAYLPTKSHRDRRSWSNVKFHHGPTIWPRIKKHHFLVGEIPMFEMLPVIKLRLLDNSWWF